MNVRRVHRRAALVVILVAAVAAPTIADAGATRTVKVVDSVYKPRSITVRSGTKVIWAFNGTLPHNVQVDRGPELFSSTILKHGTFAHRMRARGTYRIVCSLHTNMTMRVIVR